MCVGACLMRAGKGETGKGGEHKGSAVGREGTHMLARRGDGLVEQREADLACELGEQLFFEARGVVVVVVVVVA